MTVTRFRSLSRPMSRASFRFSSFRRVVQPGLLSAVSLAVAVALAGCSSDGGNGTGGTGGTGSGGTGSGGSGGSGGGTGGTGTGGTGTGGTGGGAGGALTTYKTCDPAQRLGEFVVTVSNEDPDNRFTSIGGQVTDAPNPLRIGKMLKQIGDCRVMQPPELRCMPACDVLTQECTATGCKPKARAKSVGKVTVSGLKSGSVELTYVAESYDAPGTLPHPPYDEGATLTLQAAGDSGWGPFTLKGYGITPLMTPTTPLNVKAGQPAALTWNAPTGSGPTRMFIDFSINRHGSIDTWLECTVPDTGMFTVTAEMMDELFKNGVSGFPSVRLVRQSADTTMVQSGCVQLTVAAPLTRDLAVEGVVSCNDDDKPCPNGKMCQEDLRCPP